VRSENKHAAAPAIAAKTMNLVIARPLDGHAPASPQLFIRLTVTVYQAGH
jgi:hypothetical protein